MGSLHGLPEAHFYILVALAEGDRHGYSIMQEVESLTNGKTRLSPGTLYGAIQRLLEQGYIRETNADQRRRYYRITSAGRDAAESEVERLEGLLDKARASGLSPRRHHA